ncbi:hypothetical protein ACI2L1_16460 [Streptomyces sp. NPDC019531]|uniref:hypothetical protein n=1 Tax=Streptomyces sp. NPDC019531 TaxID=3365062 RepID=UPI00384FDEB4
MAVSALSGCVTIQRPPLSGPPPSTAPSQLPGPRDARPDGQAEPEIVQAPAQEALSMIDPSRSSKPSGTAPRGTGSGASAAPGQQQNGQPAHTRPAHPEHPAHPAPPEQRHPDVRHPRQPRVEIPDVAKSVPKSVPKDARDVCALGKKYGRWRADSPEAVICDQAYGR